MKTIPVSNSEWKDDDLNNKWKRIRYIRSLVLSEIEEVRNKNIIKSSLQASVEITLSQEDRNLFENLIAADLFITSEVNFSIEEVQKPIVKISSSL